MSNVDYIFLSNLLAGQFAGVGPVRLKLVVGRCAVVAAWIVVVCLFKGIY